MSDYNNINNNFGLTYTVDYLQKTATITFNKPEIYNALNLEMIQQLSKYYKQVNKDSNIKLLIINANGKHFSSGADLNWMKNVQNYPTKQNLQDAKQLANMLLLLYNLSKPVLCAIQGNVYGGALGIIACADIVIASNNSQFCFSEVKLGLAPAIITPFILNAISPHIAKYRILTATSFSAEIAYELGLVHELIDIIDLPKRIAWHTNNINSLGFEGITSSKKLLNNFRPKISIKTLEPCIKMITKLRKSSKAQELIKKFFNHYESK